MAISCDWQSERTWSETELDDARDILTGFAAASMAAEYGLVMLAEPGVTKEDQGLEQKPDR
jgi:hypothetical protein